MNDIEMMQEPMEITANHHFPVERNGSGVELWTLDYENPGLNPVLQC